MNYRWNILQQENKDVLQTLLENRQISKEEETAFLEPNWDRHTHDPMLFDDMKEAVDIICKGMREGKKILIHGDYDADGVSGTTLLYTTLQDVQKEFGFTALIDVFLPDREKDGYGVAMHTVERLGEEKTEILVTVDCGIANAKELDRAGELGMEVIICDHHQLGETLPEKAKIIHPLAPQGQKYPNKHLCGTGVAFKFASAVLQRAKERGTSFPVGYEKWLLDLVAIATVTDVMPLLGENRVLEKYGLMVLEKTRRKGIQEILQFASNKGGIDTQTIGFQIGPRLNAAGRIRSAKTAFDALAAETDEEARKQAEQLELINRERRRISDAAYKEARVKVQEEGKKPVYVIWSDTWNPGIIGLVAGKITSEFGVPAFVLTRSGEHFVGSGRSVGGLDLVQAMRSCGDIFVKAGGHPQACGLTIATEELVETFKERVTEYASDFFNGEVLEPELNIEMILPLEKVDWALWEDIVKLEPYGEKNPRPVFADKGLQVISAERMGKTQTHLRLRVNPKEGEVQSLVGFGFGDKADELHFGDLVDIAYEVQVNEWNGNRQLQCRIIDIRPSEL